VSAAVQRLQDAGVEASATVLRGLARDLVLDFARSRTRTSWSWGPALARRSPPGCSAASRSSCWRARRVRAGHPLAEGLTAPARGPVRSVARDARTPAQRAEHLAGATAGGLAAPRRTGERDGGPGPAPARGAGATGGDAAAAGAHLGRRSQHRREAQAAGHQDAEHERTARATTNGRPQDEHQQQAAGCRGRQSDERACTCTSGNRDSRQAPATTTAPPPPRRARAHGPGTPSAARRRDHAEAEEVDSESSCAPKVWSPPARRASAPSTPSSPAASRTSGRPTPATSDEQQGQQPGEQADCWSPGWRAAGAGARRYRARSRNSG
jgi:hypothetical protein